MMISEALELYVEGGRVDHSWCMGVVRHGYGGMAEMEVVDGRHVGPSQECWSHVGRCLSIFRVRGDTLMTTDNTTDLDRCCV